MIEIRCFDSFASAAFLREEVNALNRLCGNPDPFSTFEFFETFLLHDEFYPAGRGLRLWFLTAFSSGQLIGYLALKQVARKTLGIRASTVGFLVTHDTDRPHLVAKPEYQTQVSEAFYAYLLERKQQWSLLEFQQQDSTSALFPPPSAVALNGCLVKKWPSMENCTIHLRWDTLREYYAALSKKFRDNLTRQMRYLLAAGNVEWLASSDPAVTPALFELYLGIEPRSWKSQANANIGRHPQRVAYFRGLLDARQPMRITIQLLVLDGVPIAGCINGSFMKGLYALHIVYDDSMRRLGPGLAMLLMSVRQSIDGQYAFFNLLSGFGYFKTRWLAQTTETRIAQIYRVGSLLFWRRTFGDWMRQVFAARTKQAPALFNPARRDVGERKDALQDTSQNASRDTPSESNKIPKPTMSTEEQAHVSALLAEVRRGQCDSLTTAELAAVMLPAKRKPKENSAARTTA